MRFLIPTLAAAAALSIAAQPPLSIGLAAGLTDLDLTSAAGAQAAVHRMAGAALQLWAKHLGVAGVDHVEVHTRPAVRLVG